MKNIIYIIIYNNLSIKKYLNNISYTNNYN